jgi:hypothetical protein
VAEIGPPLRAFRVIGRRERIAQLHGVWRNTVLMERRSPVVGCQRSWRDGAGATAGLA